MTIWGIAQIRPILDRHHPMTFYYTRDNSEETNERKHYYSYNLRNKSSAHDVYDA